MTLEDFFKFEVEASEADRMLQLYVRIFGLDIVLGLFGYLNDWRFPFQFMPKLRGFYLQVIFAGLFVGRLKEVNIVPD